ncbi:MAG: spondin domain-containing protein [Bacteroidota bacterium]
MLRSLLTLSILGLTLAACDSSDPDIEPPIDATQFRIEIENVAQPFGVLKSGVFNTPVGASAPAPIFPGEVYEFSFTAGPNVTPGSGMRLSFATMFIQSNDLFYTFPADGLALYDASGNARTGDVTSEILLYDAGTEVNEEPGVGTNQAPRQSGADTGGEENGVLGRIEEGAADRAGFTYPNNADVIRVLLSHDGDTEFTVRIENVSTSSTLATSTGSVAVPLSPGGWAVHVDAVDFFESGTAAPQWVEAIAEDGSPGPFADAFTPLTGITVPLSPGAVVVHEDAVDFFTSGQAASAGIEGIAEDGSPGALVAALTGVQGVSSVAAFDTPTGASGPSPIGPGGSYTIEVEAEPGDRLSFATMFIQSNDLFYTFSGDGLALFDASGAAVSGDVTSQVLLYDAGTEANQEPGVGLDQAPRQSGADTGAEENGTLGRITDGASDRAGFTYPSTADVIRVTVTPLN